MAYQLFSSVVGGEYSSGRESLTFPGSVRSGIAGEWLVSPLRNPSRSPVAGRARCWRQTDVAPREAPQHIATVGLDLRLIPVAALAGACPYCVPPRRLDTGPGLPDGTVGNERSTTPIRHYPNLVADPRPGSHIPHFGDPRVWGG